MKNLNSWKSLKGIHNSSKKCPEKVTMEVTARQKTRVALSKLPEE